MADKMLTKANKELCCVGGRREGRWENGLDLAWFCFVLVELSVTFLKCFFPFSFFFFFLK